MIEHGKEQGPILLIHGGAGDTLNSDREKIVRSELNRIINDSFKLLKDGQSATDVVCQAVGLLETSGEFNAGIGSVLQRDGSSRKTASLMDGKKQSFSAVHQIQWTDQPSLIAKALQEKEDRILGGSGAQLIARELGLEANEEVSEKQLEKLLNFKQKPENIKCGTVGAVAIDTNGNLSAATSTGGVINTFPDRMSDSGTVAGNYASEFAAVSMTGMGDHITDTGAAVKIETRVRDGLELKEASNKLLAEINSKNYLVGWIALDKNGNWVISHSTPSISAALASGNQASPLVLANKRSST